MLEIASRSLRGVREIVSNPFVIRLSSAKDVISMVDLDNAKIDEFSGRMLGIINNSMLGLMTSIGYRTNLFESMSKMPPSTSTQIAKQSGLSDRYVLEWLNTMVVGDLVDYDPEKQLYNLPPEHAAVITEKAGLGNMARFSQLIKILASVEDEIVECFQNGGGVPYEYYPEFLKFWADWGAQFYDSTLISKALPQMPDMVSMMNSGISVLDVGCGYGHTTNLIAKHFPKCKVTGYDFSELAIQAAKEKAKSLELSNINFEIKNIEELNEPEKYGLITAFDCIHDQAKPTVVLNAIFKSLANNGTFLMVDIKSSSNVEENKDHPSAPWLYTTSTMHCMTVSLANNGRGLGTMWGKQTAVSMLKDAGFTKVEVKEIEDDIFNYYYIAKK